MEKLWIEMDSDTESEKHEGYRNKLLIFVSSEHVRLISRTSGVVNVPRMGCDSLYLISPN